jgi:multidrug efflux pump subunit AcrA (membrane-fusion protein)
MQLVPVYADDVAGSVAPTGMQSDQGALVDPAVQRLYGIQVVPVRRESGNGQARLVGRVQADETRIFRLDFGADGYVKETHADAVGSHVSKDQHLATVYSPEFLTAAGGYLAANEHAPGTPLGPRDTSGPAMQNAASASARADRLRNLGVSDAQIEEMSRTHRLPEDIYVVSPVDGFVLSRNIAPGMRFERHNELYSIADLSHVWIMADAFGHDARSLHVGQTARVTVPELNETFTASIALVMPEVDPATRATRVRLETNNPGFKLRPGMFVNVDLPVAAPPGLTVPVDAIVDSGISRRVFVRTEDSRFVPRIVRTGMEVGDRIQILEGLKEGDEVVSSGTFLIDSESRLHTTASP